MMLTQLHTSWYRMETKQSWYVCRHSIPTPTNQDTNHLPSKYKSDALPQS